MTRKEVIDFISSNTKWEFLEESVTPIYGNDSLLTLYFRIKKDITTGIVFKMACNTLLYPDPFCDREFYSTQEYLTHLVKGY